MTFLGFRVRTTALIWWHVHGRAPTRPILHVNGDAKDYRLANLREGYARTPLRYDPATGVIDWGSTPARLRTAATVWKKAYGRDPEGRVEHVNGDRSDFRLANLREQAEAAPPASLRDLLRVDGDGKLRWRVTRRRCPAGAEAGAGGVLTVGGKRYATARVVAMLGAGRPAVTQQGDGWGFSVAGFRTREAAERALAVAKAAAIEGRTAP